MGIPFFIVFVLSIAFLSLGDNWVGGLRLSGVASAGLTRGGHPLPQFASQLFSSRAMRFRVSTISGEPLCYGFSPLS